MNEIVYKLHPELFSNDRVREHEFIKRLSKCENSEPCKELMYEMFLNNTSNTVPLATLGDNIHMDKDTVNRCVDELVICKVLTIDKVIPSKESEELNGASEELKKQRKAFRKVPRFRKV